MAHKTTNTKRKPSRQKRRKEVPETQPPPEEQRETVRFFRDEAEGLADNLDDWSTMGHKIASDIRDRFPKAAVPVTEGIIRAADRARIKSAFVDAYNSGSIAESRREHGEPVTVRKTVILEILKDLEEIGVRFQAVTDALCSEVGA